MICWDNAQASKQSYDCPSEEIWENMGKIGLYPQKSQQSANRMHNCSAVQYGFDLRLISIKWYGIHV